MGPVILIPSAEGGFSGQVRYGSAFSDLTTNERRRAAVRTCLAGEAARGARSLQEFLDGAARDLDKARSIAADVDDGGDIDEVLADEFERTVDQVEAHAAARAAVAAKLLATASPDGKYRSLTGISAARAMGWHPVRDEKNVIVCFEPDPPS